MFKFKERERETENKQNDSLLKTNNFYAQEIRFLLHSFYRLDGIGEYISLSNANKDM
jgi:hypothetical protein